MEKTIILGSIYLFLNQEVMLIVYYLRFNNSDIEYKITDSKYESLVIAFHLHYTLSYKPVLPDISFIK
jgi:hypothetical protein